MFESMVMRFQAPDGLSFIEIERRDEDGYSVFDVTASIEGFTGRNPGVIFTECAEFLNQLQAFDASRKGKVTLDGTEQCQLSIAAYDRTGHMRVDIRLCRYRNQADSETTILSLEGGFVLDAEYANRLFRELRELLRGCS